MKHILIILFIIVFGFSYGQQQDQRIQNIKSQLELLSMDTVGLTENVKTEISVNNITLANFLLGISEVHKVNINVAPELNQITLVNNFSNVTVGNLLVFLCKEYDLTIDFTGNILSVKKYNAPTIPEAEAVVKYNPSNNTISINANKHKLFEVFKRIMDESAKNLVFTPGMENHPLTAYFQNIPFDVAMDKLALANNLYLDKTKDNFYVFDRPITTTAENTTAKPRVQRNRSNSFEFKILDKATKLLEVDFTDTSIEYVINDISEALDLNVFTATPLSETGKASLKANAIGFDDLLVKLFESQTTSSSPPATNTQNNRNQSSTAANTSQSFSFKKEGNIYFFGTEDQLSIRKVEAIYLQFRSVELLADPETGGYQNSATNRVFDNLNATNDNFGGYQNNTGGNRGRESLNGNNREQFDDYGNKGEALISILPDELKEDLDIKIDFELNAFYVNGPSAKVDRFKDFVKQIDKPVPVILIEVMILEVSRSAIIEAGVSWGIADAPTTTQGSVFPTTDLNLGAKTVNKIIGSFNDFAGFNLGKVGPNFFASIKAMEANGDLKVKSTPRLATLNSHRATFSNGQTSFYAVTRRNIYGTDNPQTSEITNYLPIEAELGLTIKPSVSGNGQVLLDISVIQSSFGGRVADDAPPDVNSRSFSSLIRMQDQDIAILGGLEEQMKNDSGNGVPLLARVPVIKWLFSKRKREARKSKLTVLIKPTVIY